jgi:hypothetical protein
MTRLEDPARQEDPTLTYLTHSAAYGSLLSLSDCQAEPCEPSSAERSASQFRPCPTG